MKPDQVILQIMRASAACDESLLSGRERERARSFRFQVDSARWISFRVSLRRILGDALGVKPEEVPIEIDAFGKPRLAPPHADLHFNLSHAGDLGLVAISTTGPVGVDLEPMERAADLLGCEESFCHPSEVAALPTEATGRAAKLLELWTLKEAVLKAVGTGFLLPPETVIFESCEDSSFKARVDGRHEALEQQRVRLIRHPLLSGHQVAISSLAEHWELADGKASTGPVGTPTMRPWSETRDG